MKITGGSFNGRKIIAPKSLSVRPTLSKTRQSVFNVLKSLIGKFDDKNFLDMFSGSGIMGLEALSRGFSSVLSVENDFKTAKIIQENYKNLGLSSNLLIKNSLKVDYEQSFDVIYADPPYFKGLYQKIIDKVRNDNLLKDENSLLVLEKSANVPIDFDCYKILSEKKYSDTKIIFLKLNI